MAYESKDELVSHPSHYQSETGLEVIDVIEAFTFDLKGIEAVDTANVLKYICRWDKKNGLQDLEKAMWYLQHLIEHVRKLKEENEQVGLYANGQKVASISNNKDEKEIFKSYENDRNC